MKLPIQSVPIERSDVWSPNRSNSSAGVNPAEHYDGYSDAACTNFIVQGDKNTVCSHGSVTHYIHETHPHQLLGGPKRTKRGSCTQCPGTDPSRNIPPPGMYVPFSQFVGPR